MKSKVVFHRRKMEISKEKGIVARYYSELMYVRYTEPYCYLHFRDGVKYQLETTIDYLLKNLPKQPFFRCNRHEIINLCFFSEYKEEPFMVILEDGTGFKLSFRNVHAFKKQKTGMKCISPVCPHCSECNNENCSDFWLFCQSPEQSTD